MDNSKEKLSEFLIKTWHEYYDKLKNSHDSTDYMDQWEYMSEALLREYPQIKESETHNEQTKRNSKK